MLAALSVCDFDTRMGTLPDQVCFNGRPDQYLHEPLREGRGERVRFYVVCAGPTGPCGFHGVGEQFGRVYPGAPPESSSRGVQTFQMGTGAR